MPCTCNKRVERDVLKVKCCECSTFFHAECANLQPSDVEYLISSNKAYTCVSCSTNRRKSSQLQHDSSIIGLSLVNNDSNASNTDINFNATTNTVTNKDLMFELTNIKSLLSNVMDELKALKEEKHKMSVEINKLKEDKNNMAIDINKLKYNINVLEQDKIKNCVDVTGIPDLTKENAEEKFLTLVKNSSLDNSISSNDIEYCYIKQKKSTFSDALSQKSKELKQNILCVKFVSYNVKECIMDKKKTEKIKINSQLFGAEYGSKPIYINNSLTYYMRTLLNKAIEIKKLNNYKYVWVKNSTVLMRKKDGDKVLKIRSFEDFVDTV